MSEQENITCEDIERALRRLGQQSSGEVLSIGHPDFTAECLPLDRVFVAIGLKQAEKEHLEQCDFCQRRVRSFTPEPLEQQGTGTVTIKRFKQPIPVRRWAVAAVVFLCFALIGWTGVTTVRRLLKEGEKLRAQLDAVHQTVGLESAVFVDFDTIQPDHTELVIRLNPILVAGASVTYDDGETWRTLYAGKAFPGGDFKPDSFVETVDRESFSAPASGTRTVKAKVKIEYMPEVLAAFPEYDEPSRKEWVGTYKLTADGIKEIVVESGKPVVLMANIPLDADRWELINTEGAIFKVWNDPTGSKLIQQFNLPNVGDYTNISHSIPGASAQVPFVSLDELTDIRVTLYWNGAQPVTIEEKLVDDFGKVVGTSRFIEADDKQQIINVGAALLKGYWNIRNFGLSNVRRFEIAVARKAINQAAEGTIEIHGIELLGTGNYLTDITGERPNLVLAELPKSPAKWQTAQSHRAKITLSAKDNLLICHAGLPYDAKADETLPWTNLETELETQNYSSLEAVELEVMWDGPASVTLEPKIVASPYYNTYGLHRRIEPTGEYQKLLVYLVDLKFYWSSADNVKVKTGMMLEDLKKFSLGISRKTTDQASTGTLYIRSIKMLSRPEVD